MPANLTGWPPTPQRVLKEWPLSTCGTASWWRSSVDLLPHLRSTSRWTVSTGTPAVLIVRKMGDVESSVVISKPCPGLESMPTQAPAPTTGRPCSCPTPRQGSRRSSVRGAEAVCQRLGVRNQVTKLRPHRFRHTGGTIVQDELGDPRVRRLPRRCAKSPRGHHGLGSVAGYTEVSSNRRAQAGDALTPRGL